jgi:hypothetical protein
LYSDGDFIECELSTHGFGYNEFKNFLEGSTGKKSYRKPTASKYSSLEIYENKSGKFFLKISHDPKGEVSTSTHYISLEKIKPIFLAAMDKALEEGILDE